jgi:hypothetical protein
MSQHDFELIDTLPTLRSCRDSDKFLMMEFLAHGYFKQDLQMLKECRKYLYVTILAEISSAAWQLLLGSMGRERYGDNQSSQRISIAKAPPPETTLLATLAAGTSTDLFLALQHVT